MIHWKSAYAEMLIRKFKMSGGKWTEGKKQFLKGRVQKEWIRKENCWLFFFFLILLITVLGSQSALGGFLFLLTKSLLTSIGNGVCLINQLSDVWLIAVVYSRSNYNSKALEVARQSIYFLWALPNSKLEAYLLETRIVIAADIQCCLTMLRLF